jgi:hypothetical protein
MRLGAELRDDLFVAGNLPLYLEPSSDPANSRIEVKNAFRQALKEVRPIVVPSHVSEHVQDDLLQLQLGQIFPEGPRQQNRGT